MNRCIEQCQVVISAQVWEQEGGEVLGGLLGGGDLSRHLSKGREGVMGITGSGFQAEDTAKP